jgi:YHS domain-containing protein
MSALMRRWALLVLSLALMLGLQTGVMAQSASPPVALKGYDPVAYFTEGKPVKGVNEISYDWDDARYLFANPKNKATFASAPDKYAPQFAALCSTGLAFGKKVESDPQVWKIVDGKLYLFSSLKAKEAAEGDPSVLSRAQAGFQEKKK